MRRVTLMLLKPPPMGVVTGPFERDLVALDRFVEGGGNVFAEDFEGLGAGGEALPLPLDAGGFEDADDGLRDFGADAVAGNEGDFVSLRYSFQLQAASHSLVRG